MKNIFKYIILISCLLSFQISFANQIDFYWERDISWDIVKESNIDKLNNSLETFYKSSWLNTDIIILGKWDECYLDNNFDSCVQGNKNYSSDLLIVLSMKSNIKDYWDIRSLIKDEYKEVITTRDLKNIQDLIIYDFKKSDYTWWINKYLIYIQDLVDTKCIEVWFNKSCDIVKLSKEYHNYVAEKEYQKKYNTMMKFIYLFMILVLIIITYILAKKYYIRSINNLYKDTKYKLTTIWDYLIFENDKKIILSKIDWLILSLKNKLWDLDKNTLNLRLFYKNHKKILANIENEISNMQKSFSQKEELKKKVEKIKKIDL